jgi:hypothetical protein
MSCNLDEPRNHDDMVYNDYSDIISGNSLPLSGSSTILYAQKNDDIGLLLLQLVLESDHYKGYGNSKPTEACPKSCLLAYEVPSLLWACGYMSKLLYCSLAALIRML